MERPETILGTEGEDDYSASDTGQSQDRFINNVTAPIGPPDDSDSNYTDPNDYNSQRGGNEIKVPSDQTREGTKDPSGQWSDRSRLGISGRMKAYQVKQTFTGGLDEYLDHCTCVYDTQSDMCEVTEVYKLKSIPIMLKGDDLNYFSSNRHGCKDYEGAT